MNRERIILAYKNYFKDFISSQSEAEARKVFYVIDMLKTQERVNAREGNQQGNTIKEGILCRKEMTL